MLRIWSSSCTDATQSPVLDIARCLEQVLALKVCSSSSSSSCPSPSTCCSPQSGIPATCTVQLHTVHSSVQLLVMQFHPLVLMAALLSRRLSHLHKLTYLHTCAYTLCSYLYRITIIHLMGHTLVSFLATNDSLVCSGPEHSDTDKSYTMQLQVASTCSVHCFCVDC